MSTTKGNALGWQDTPDPYRAVMIPIYSAKVDRPVNGVILSPALVGVKLHYFDQRSRPHIEPANLCEGCQRAIDLRWKGYLGCWDRHKGRLFLAEVTTEAYEKCGSFKEYKDRLRGLVVQLVRNGASKNARVSAKLSMWAGPANELPPAFDVKEALERIWFSHQGGRITTDEYLEGTKPEMKYGKSVCGELFRVEGPYER